MADQRLACITGLFYALNIAIGILAIYWTREDRATGDLLNLAGAAEYALVVVLLGRLFQPTARTLSWAVAGIGLVACVLSGGLLLHLYTFPADVNPVFVFGPYCIGLGVLIVRTDVIPRLLGMLLVIAGLSWLTFADPALSHHLAPWNTVAGAVPELLLTLWLIVFSIRSEAEKEGSTSDALPSET